MTSGRSKIESLRSVVKSRKFKKAAKIDPRLLKEVEDIWRDLAIEQKEEASDRPGVAGHPGASPKQLDFQRAFFAQTHRVYAASGANQSGKTLTTGALCFCKWLRDVAKDKDVYWVVAQSADTMRDIPHKTLWEFLPRSMFPKGIEYNPRFGFGLIATLHLTLPGSRGKIELWWKSEEQSLLSFESSRVNGVWWTESSSEEIFDAIAPRLAARRGWLLMDYVPQYSWHMHRIRIPAEAGAKDVFHMRFCMKDNAHNLPPGELDFQRRHMTEDEAAVRIDGQERAFFGVVYREFSAEKHVVSPFEIPSAWPRWRGLDYGYRNPTACLWCACAPAGWLAPWGEKLAEDTLFFYREFYRRERTVTQIVEEIDELSEGEVYEGGVRIDPSVYNATQANAGSIGLEFEEAGLECEPAVRTSSVGEHALVAKVRKWFEAGRIRFFNTCENCIREHRSWRYRTQRHGIVPGAEPFEDKDNHTVDVVKYLIAEDPCYHRLALEMISSLPADYED